jgi:tRNA (guanosine-2'-O-)-methyltransferase
MMKKFPDNFDYSLIRTEERINKIRQVLEKRQSDFSLVLENVHDPHNLSAVFRSCDAVGIFEVCLVYHSGQEMPKLVESSSASARKWVNHKHFTDIPSCYAYLRENGKKILTTHMAQDSQDLYDLDLTQPIALVFGNEHSGVSEDAFRLADGNFLIPQVGMVQSLNISVAAAVTLFEVFRQKRNAGQYDTCSFPQDVFNRHLQDWLSR